MVAVVAEVTLLGEEMFAVVAAVRLVTKGAGVLGVYEVVVFRSVALEFGFDVLLESSMELSVVLTTVDSITPQLGSVVEKSLVLYVVR